MSPLPLSLRAEGVAISWYTVRICTMAQEIAPQAFPSVTTSDFALLAMTEWVHGADSPGCGGCLSWDCGTARGRSLHFFMEKSARLMTGGFP